MTLKEILYQTSLHIENNRDSFCNGIKSGHTFAADRDRILADLEQAILSWFKEQLPKEKEYSKNWNQRTVGEVDGYNQCLQDILTNLTAKQGER